MMTSPRATSVIMSEEPTKRRNPETGEWESPDNEAAWRYDERRNRWEWLTLKQLNNRRAWRLALAAVVSAVVYTTIVYFVNAS